MTTKPLGAPFSWTPGQHMALIGLTGSGKSTLASRLLDQRKYVVVLRTKADDVKYRNMTTVRSADGLDDIRHDRIELKPPYERAALECQRALDKVWQMGGFCVYVDETWFVDQELGCRVYLNRLLTQGRNPGKISVVCAMQRPVSVTRFAVGEATHVLSFGLEGRDAKIVGETTSPRMQRAVTELNKHEFIWYFVPDRRMWRGRLNMRTGTLEGAEIA